MEAVERHPLRSAADHRASQGGHIVIDQEPDLDIFERELQDLNTGKLAHPDPPGVAPDQWQQRRDTDRNGKGADRPAQQGVQIHGRSGWCRSRESLRATSTKSATRAPSPVFAPSALRLVPEPGIEPGRLAAGDFKSPASTIPPLRPLDSTAGQGAAPRLEGPERRRPGRYASPLVRCNPAARRIRKRLRGVPSENSMPAR